MNLKRAQKVEEILLPSFELEEGDLFYHLDFETYEIKDVDEIVRRLCLIKEKISSLHVIIDADNRNFVDEDFGFFMLLEKKLQEHGLALYFDGGYKTDYTLIELMKADALLDNFINFINKDELSPFEKYILIYNYLARKKYKAEDVPHEDMHMPRDIIAIMNSDYIVCEGYSRIMKYICDNVGIICICQYLSVDQGKCRHMNNLIYLDDDKYDIHGLYYSDVTWDSADKFNQISYAFCLVPMADIYTIQIGIDLDPFYYLFYNPKGAFIRLLDHEGPSLVGYNPSPDFYMDSEVEAIFGIHKEVKESFDTALELYLEYRKKALTTLKKMLIDKGIPLDIFEKTFKLPHGSSLPMMVAALCTYEEGESFVEVGISNLLLHIQKPFDKEGGFYEGEELPYFRTPDVYKAIDYLLQMKDEEINLPLEELERINEERRELPYDPAYTFEDWVVRKDGYYYLLAILRRIRNIYIFDLAKEIVIKHFPHGEPISLEKYHDAIKTALLYEGVNEKEVETSVKQLLDCSIRRSLPAYDNNAINCFKKEADKIR